VIRLDLTPRTHSFTLRLWPQVRGCRHCGAERRVLAWGRGGYGGTGAATRNRMVDGQWITYTPRADMRESCHAPRHAREAAEECHALRRAS